MYICIYTYIHTHAHEAGRQARAPAACGSFSRPSAPGAAVAPASAAQVPVVSPAPTPPLQPRRPPAPPAPPPLPPAICVHTDLRPGGVSAAAVGLPRGAKPLCPRPTLHCPCWWTRWARRGSHPALRPACSPPSARVPPKLACWRGVCGGVLCC